jgi:hypothetical protein
VTARGPHGTRWAGSKRTVNEATLLADHEKQSCKKKVPVAGFRVHLQLQE